MSKKNVTFTENQNAILPICSLPKYIKLKTLTNQIDPNELVTLRLRIDELENKVNELQTKIKSKHKRIRRKSCEVDKRHKCQFCKKLYGSLVSLNLHLRIKHRKQRLEKNRERRDEKKQESQSFPVAQSFK